MNPRYNHLSIYLSIHFTSDAQRPVINQLILSILCLLSFIYKQCILLLSPFHLLLLLFTFFSNISHIYVFIDNFFFSFSSFYLLFDDNFFFFLHVVCVCDNYKKKKSREKQNCDEIRLFCLMYQCLFVFFFYWAK
jgi:hypothetical protein